MLLEQYQTFVEKTISTYTLFFQISLAILVVVSLFGLLVIRRDLVTILIATELMFLNSILLLLPFCYISGVISGQILILFILVVAAAETAVTFAIMSNFYFNNVLSKRNK